MRTACAADDVDALSTARLVSRLYNLHTNAKRKRIIQLVGNAKYDTIVQYSVYKLKRYMSRAFISKQKQLQQKTSCLQNDDHKAKVTSTTGFSRTCAMTSAPTNDALTNRARDTAACRVSPATRSARVFWAERSAPGDDSASVAQPSRRPAGARRRNTDDGQQYT